MANNVPAFSLKPVVLLLLVIFFISDDLYAKRSKRGYSRSKGFKSYSVRSYTPKSYRSRPYKRKSPKSSYRKKYSSRTRSYFPKISFSSSKRNRGVRTSFHRSNPCPSTGRNRGSCPGYEVDHIVPLACGGSDSVGNMQWLTKSANRSKGAMGCRRKR